MSQSWMTRRRRQRGQMAVETAIVMPLFVFLVLGIIQLSLMHQARSVTKYAAFRAARAGSMENANRQRMEQAAWDVLRPLVRIRDNAGAQHAEVVICAPTQGVANAARGNQTLSNNPNLSFDYPLPPGQDFGARKLAIQLTFHYPLFIPFADGVIYTISRGEENIREALFKDVVRMGTNAGGEAGVLGPRGNDARRQVVQAATGTQFVVPIRANYALRLQSDVRVNTLPNDNNCVRL